MEITGIQTILIVLIVTSIAMTGLAVANVIAKAKKEKDRAFYSAKYRPGVDTVQR